MATQIFVNLPVRDLNRSIAFYAALGWAHNPQFTDETAALWGSVPPEMGDLTAEHSRAHRRQVVVDAVTALVRG